MSEPTADIAETGDIDDVAVAQSAPLRRLRKTQRSFVFPLSVAFLLWYFVYVLLSSFAADFQRVWGDIRGGHIVHRHSRQLKQHNSGGLLRGRSLVHRLAEWIAISDDYLSAASFLASAAPLP